MILLLSQNNLTDITSIGLNHHALSLDPITTRLRGFKDTNYIEFGTFMMLLVSQHQDTVSNFSELEKKPTLFWYRGWSINSELVGGELWVRWQHPEETFSRYGCPTTHARIHSTIDYVQSLIDLTIYLENDASSAYERN